MGFASLLRSGVALADKLTKDLQLTVTHHVWQSQTIGGASSYTTVSRKALVDLKQQQVRSASGQLVAARAMVTFLTPVAVSVKDKIQLPDGTVNTIIDVGGFADPLTGRGYVTDVWLG